MKVIVLGDTSSLYEFKLKFSKLINEVNSSEKLSDKKKNDKDQQKKIVIDEVVFIKSYESFNIDLTRDGAIIFDFFLDESIENFDLYKDNDQLIIFGNIPKSSLSEVRFYYGDVVAVVFGFNGLPGMLNREYLEVTSYNNDNHILLKEVCEALQTDYLLVDDRVGMVTLRVIAMIINEAYYTVQEGTANKKDIDTAMKLGTNYPYGPFEWSKKLGIKNVYELLEALYEDTKDVRYKICPLLKKEYMRS